MMIKYEDCDAIFALSSDVKYQMMVIDYCITAPRDKVLDTDTGHCEMMCSSKIEHQKENKDKKGK